MVRSFFVFEHLFDKIRTDVFSSQGMEVMEIMFLKVVQGEKKKLCDV